MLEWKTEDGTSQGPLEPAVAGRTHYDRPDTLYPHPGHPTFESPDKVWTNTPLDKGHWVKSILTVR